MIRRVLAPFRTVFAITIVAAVPIVVGSYVIILVKVRPRTRLVTPIMHLWARTFLLVTGTRVHVEGLDKIDPDASYVFSGNHISSMEIPVMIGLPSDEGNGARFADCGVPNIHCHAWS